MPRGCSSHAYDTVHVFQVGASKEDFEEKLHELRSLKVGPILNKYVQPEGSTGRSERNSGNHEHEEL